MHLCLCALGDHLCTDSVTYAAAEVVAEEEVKCPLIIVCMRRTLCVLCDEIAKDGRETRVAV
jgi:hypothetical protein